MLGVVDTIDVGAGPAGLTVSPNGTRVYVANALDGTVSVINTATLGVTATIPVDEIPLGVAFNPGGTRAYVNNAESGTLSVITPPPTR